MIPILLTATVNPRGMQGAAFAPEERAQQYVEALRFYLQALPDQAQQFVFAENSGSIEYVRRHLATEQRIEWLDVEQLADGKAYDQTRGKGYNEVLLLEAAVLQSAVIGRAGQFFKVTGRLKVLNIARLMAECEGFEFRADCKDHNVYEWLRMPINGHAGECRYWFASNAFFLAEIAPHYDRLNDYGKHPVLAEDLMLDVCRKARHCAGCKDRFCTQARISGRGGHHLGQGLAFFYSTDNDSLALHLKCGMRQLLRWIMPWWRC